eukprot:3941387-Rhodomonas_salina.2
MSGTDIEYAATGFGAWYAMSGIDIAHGACSLRDCYVMSGTDQAWCQVLDNALKGREKSNFEVRSYAMSGTEMVYDPTPSVCDVRHRAMRCPFPLFTKDKRRVSPLCPYAYFDSLFSFYTVSSTDLGCTAPMSRVLTSAMLLPGRSTAQCYHAEGCHGRNRWRDRSTPLSASGLATRCPTIMLRIRYAMSGTGLAHTSRLRKVVSQAVLKSWYCEMRGLVLKQRMGG